MIRVPGLNRLPPEATRVAMRLAAVLVLGVVLSALSGASSSRVLNLLAIGLTQAENEGHRNAPLFGSFIINNSIILKHRLRADEIDLFPVRRGIIVRA